MKINKKTESLKSNIQGIKDQRVLKLIDECISIYQDAGYDIADFQLRWPLSFIQSTGSVNTFGNCSYPKYDGDTTYITLNSYMFEESDEAIKSTILHELAHYVNHCDQLDHNIIYFNLNGHLVGNRNKYDKSLHGPHGRYWKYIANVISNKTGIDINRTSTYNLHTNVGKAAEEKYKYIVTCQNCGNTLKYMKKTDFVKNPNISHYDMLVQKYGSYWVETHYPTKDKINKIKDDYYWSCGRCKSSGNFVVKENK